MFYHAIKLASSYRGGLDVTQEARDAVLVTSHLSTTMALYRQRVCPSFDPARRGEDDHHDHMLILSMALAQAAMIQMLNIFSEQDVAAYNQRLDIARTCARLAAEVCQTSHAKNAISAPMALCLRSTSMGIHSPPWSEGKPSCS
ncbi:hypothetical protein BOTBODRAFT_389068 [Botryobasidium botryosum FD-172 SS1]|uniref:BRO1 domain-containing protein n=1 Tax=Botryobasidium botryosum (strain FD-172 SS1) TaxID=930990 RepID=A0A067MZN9_BOTB1|nr:hypothetical protein BOTBODRAFT_389068 [Botryobasidium botryosum FD-172 SS1]